MLKVEKSDEGIRLPSALWILWDPCDLFFLLWLRKQHWFSVLMASVELQLFNSSQNPKTGSKLLPCHAGLRSLTLKIQGSSTSASISSKARYPRLPSDSLALVLLMPHTRSILPTLKKAIPRSWSRSTRNCCTRLSMQLSMPARILKRSCFKLDTRYVLPRHFFGIWRHERTIITDMHV